MNKSAHIAYIATAALAFYVGAMAFDKQTPDALATKVPNIPDSRSKLITGCRTTSETNMEAGPGADTLAGNTNAAANHQPAGPSVTDNYDDDLSANDWGVDYEDTPDYLFSALGLSDHPAVDQNTPIDEYGNNSGFIADIESKLIYGDMDADKRMALLINYLNNFNYDGHVSEHFFNDLLSHATSMPEDEQANIIRLAADSFYDDLSQHGSDAWETRVDGLMNFSNSPNESVRESLLLSLAAVPGLEEERALLLAQYRNDPSEKVRAMATIIENQLQSGLD